MSTLTPDVAALREWTSANLFDSPAPKAQAIDNYRADRIVARLESTDSVVGR